MSLKFIIGKPGTGKTTMCLEEIGSKLSNDTPLYYLVPEQFSLQAEKLLLSKHDATIKVQAVSFSRLAYRLFATFGGAPNKVIDDLGKQMLLRKVLFDIGDKLTYYKKPVEKPGFIDSISQSITEMSHNRITANDLEALINNSTPILGAKLTDIVAISRAYHQQVEGNFLLTDDMLDLLCVQLENLGDSPLPLLDNAEFWIDGFSGFTAQELHLLTYLMKRASSITVSLTTDLQSPNFSPPYITKTLLEKIAKNNEVALEKEIELKADFRHINSKSLTHFVENFNISRPLSNFSEQCESIKIIAAQDNYAATLTAANQILKLVKNKGYDFRDIAILCGDKDSYEKILNTTFDRLNIPLFVDTDISILSHPLTELIRAGLDIIVRNWNYESVFRFLKTRLTTISLDNIDKLENYVLEHGISGYRWRYPFKCHVCELARLELLRILDIFHNAGKKDSIENHSRKIYDMLGILNTAECLQSWYDISMSQDNRELAQLHIQIWPKIASVFDKLVDIVGNEYVSTKTFAQILDAGLNQVTLGRIPPTTNQVLFGDIRRSRYPKIKAMIVLGANDNALPPAPNTSGIFSDRERAVLNNLDVKLATSNISRMAEDRYNLYCALSQPSEKLVIIYSLAQTSGKLLRPAQVVTQLLKTYKRLEISYAEPVAEYENVASVQNIQNALSQDSIESIYIGDGDIISTAASRLETFAKCPFAYYMTYILKAKQRKKFEILSVDLGLMYHDVLANFSKQIWEKGIDASQINIPEHIANIMETFDIDKFNDNARNKYILNKVQRVSAASIWALSQHLNNGHFLPTLTEAKITTLQKHNILLSNGKKLALTGVVDRLDVLKPDTENSEFLKIIDYKSGNTKFNIEEVRLGLQLQLMIYMNVLTKLRDAKPGGIYYFNIDDPILSTDIELDDEMRKAGILKQFKLSGITIADDTVVSGMDNTLTPGKDSSIIPVGIKTNGQYKKSQKPRLLSSSEFEELSKEVDEKILEIGNKMTNGNITAKPLVYGQKSPCAYCNYSTICGKAKYV